MLAYIDGTALEVQCGETILEAARRLGRDIPTLCEFAPLGHRPGTCRMCLAEITRKDGSVTISTTCDTKLEDGMRVRTRTSEVREARRRQMMRLFADHCENCSSCARHGSCELQSLAKKVGLTLPARSGRLDPHRPGPDRSAPALVFDASKCIRCLRCVEACRQLQGIGAITLQGRGTRAAVGFDGQPWGESDRCIQCGQCSLVCPTGAISVKDETERALDLLASPKVMTVVQIAPAARIALAEAVGAPSGTNLEGQLVAGLKAAGADLVCDARWSADVTILEEGTELLERLRRQKEAGTLDKPDTMFTSCCPGWINHVEKSAPDMIPHISSTRSPQAIFGALAKTWLAQTRRLKPEQIAVISIMPCTAKKDEASRRLLEHDGKTDVDLVLTVRETALLFERCGLDILKMEPRGFDSPFMTEASGAAQLFATTGGVMEAALRTVAALSGGPKLGGIAFTPVRGLANVREAEVETAEFGKIRIAAAYGIPSAEAIVKLVREGRSPYHFVEVMACPGGCIGGGGTAREGFGREKLLKRQETVYRTDAEMPIHCSHENPEVVRLYRDFLEKPGSHLAHELLHCTYEDRSKEAECPSFEALVKAGALLKG